MPERHVIDCLASTATQQIHALVDRERR